MMILGRCIALIGGLVAGGAALAAGDAPGTGSAPAMAQPPRIEVPAGFCVVEPNESPVHARLWQAFAPPPSRGAFQKLLAVGCETLRAAEAGRLTRPARLFGIYALVPDPALPTSAEAALAALEKRFSRPDLAAKAPILGRDRQAIYLEQGHDAAPGSTAPRGVSAFTFRGKNGFIVNVFYFGEAPPIATVRAQAEVAVRSFLTADP